MAKSISSLALGSKIKDSKGNIFTVIAHNHYGTGETVLWDTGYTHTTKLYSSETAYVKYTSTEADYYLTNTYPKRLPSELLNYINTTSIQIINPSTARKETIKRKYFILSMTELWGDEGIHENEESIGKKFSYFNNRNNIYLSGSAHSKYDNTLWTRTPCTGDTDYFVVYYSSDDREYQDYCEPTTYQYGVRSTFTVSNILVTDNVSNGYYSFVFNQPPVIENIQSIEGNYGSPTNITYVATDGDGDSLTHYFSKDNGNSWEEISPTKVNNSYTFSYLFNELNTHTCRIKVVDSNGNSTTSNMFTVSINELAPTISILSAIDKTITFKVGCITSEISKVEIFINNTLVNTVTSGFNSSLSYTINSDNLTQGKNEATIKATSVANLVGTRDFEINKSSYNLPPVGTKVIINNVEYTITKATENNGLQNYTLDRQLETNVNINDEISILQDRVRVKCGLSNISNIKDFKEMKLVKNKKLKGAFEGYIEEKYELEGEGRYSSIKLELEKFNDNIDTGIIELQQYFDYKED